ncbi:tRNA(Ser) Um(44) 2'-O-methyltransferase [Microsporum canis]|uniref:tRNA (uracil-O(2)-)-methyltransferase n=1 Tax=Arthroderma otae (strain ATCC MYA-4605 / CBS 113480) TaxID=554155 RepID=C5FKM0_ARTOC|nr:DUF1613 domain-containing protein [Microsporum canis CBS 113480]EEQ30242.1 DUF1613 domain-containing protein [Microsporum canis CBS 113480]
MPARKKKKNGERTSPADFAQSLQPSFLATDGEDWITAPSLSRPELSFSPAIFLSVSTHLLANPNLVSPSLFRADILHDSSGVLETASSDARGTEIEHGVRSPAPLPGFEPMRVVVRRLIPRNPNLDPTHDQTCHIYRGINGREDSQKTSYLAVYCPHATAEQDVPYYHPAVRGFALLYTHSDASGSGALSLHFLPFSSGIPATIPNRLHRTLLNLLSTHVRLASGPSATSHATGSQPRPFKDNLIPQHTVQNTYTRLKSKYAHSLVRNWVEVTEPSKHVFEDLSIAAFLIELWGIIYHLPTSAPTEDADAHVDVTRQEPPRRKVGFPGFVDIACGNGVLVYILLSEGYDGWGFDARSRKTWSIFPAWVQVRLKERICVPQPFKDVLPQNHGDSTDSGHFGSGTFIISNHADELTLWTPLLGVLSNPSQPLPFLAIPCCSHGLSGARYRYPPPKDSALKGSYGEAEEMESNPLDENEEGYHDQGPQPRSGDLKALRSKVLEARQNPGSTSSTYGSLTAKLVCIAKEVGYEVDRTLLRIPSTRNIGVIGGLKAWQAITPPPEQSNTSLGERLEGMTLDVDKRREKVQSVVERETSRDGGLVVSANSWLERSMGLVKGQGRGKLNDATNEHHN